jgi:hypothetical protein
LAKEDQQKQEHGVDHETYPQADRRRGHRRRRLMAAVGGLLLTAVAAALTMAACGAQSSVGPPAPSSSSLSPSPPARVPTRAATPTPRAIRAAIAYLKEREGDAAVAIVDTQGELHGYRTDRRFTSASVVKAMLLVQYLRSHSSVPSTMRPALRAMITKSDNPSAYLVHAVVRDKGLRVLAEDAGMTRFSVGDDILYSRITAADQARFFHDMDAYIPPRHRAFARRLLSEIDESQTWGVAEVARPRWRVYFKSGWFGTTGQPHRLVNQVARLERGEAAWSVAILTDDNPDSTYAFETLRGLTRRLLSQTPYDTRTRSGD